MIYDLIYDYDALKSRTNAYAVKVQRLFEESMESLLDLHKRLPRLDTGVMYSFDAQSKAIQKEVAAILEDLHASCVLAIKAGIKTEWDKANEACDALLKECFGKNAVKDATFAAYVGRHAAAMNTFINRTEKGMGLSDRIWIPVKQFREEMEIAMTVAINEGSSASSMSRLVRKYLNDPDLMFRRFRYKKGEDGDGNPIYGRKWKKRVKNDDGTYSWIDYDRDSYPSGVGVYKSAYKNAMRMTRTETNMAYRKADHERWADMDFVLGIEISISNNHPEEPENEICERLQGRYPKSFVFTGWHPQCMCHAVPILPSDEELENMAYALGAGEEYTLTGEVTEYPRAFVRWVEEHADDIEQAEERGTLPYFIRENRKVVKGMM